MWVALILYATLATKEHYAADIVTGIALALLADWWAWRGRGTNRRGLLGNQRVRGMRRDLALAHLLPEPDDIHS